MDQQNPRPEPQKTQKKQQNPQNTQPQFQKPQQSQQKQKKQEPIPSQSENINPNQVQPSHEHNPINLQNSNNNQPVINDDNDDNDQWESFNNNQQDDQQQLMQSQEKQQQSQDGFGCQHYFRNCQVQAPCCRIFYTCKLCHDEKYQGPKSKVCTVERMAFSDVKNIRCLKCKKVQQPSIKCSNPECQITFGKYACLKCKLYENNPLKVNDIFHCEECKMCRRGSVENFFHCKVCGYCRHISQKNNHKCAENIAESKCPICLQVLKYSLKKYVPMPCGHLIHLKCQAEYRGLNCPVCGMATQKLSQDINKQIQQQIQLTKANLPKELMDKKVDVLCNQCLHKSYQVPFHFFGIKCQGCGTYNTKLI